MKNDVRRITDGAMMCAIVGAFLLINRQFGGLLQDMFLFLFPIPMIFYSAKYGWKESWIVYFAMCLLGFILGGVTTLFYVASESLIGLIYGSGIYAHKNTHKLVLITMAAGAVINVISTVVFASVFGYDIAAETKEMEQMMNQVFAQTGTQLPPTVNLTQYIGTLIVVTAILTGVLQGFVTHVLSRLLLKRLRFPVEPPTPVSAYYPPKWSGYLGMAGFLCFYYSLFRPFKDEMLQSAFQGLGMCGYLYLLIYGFIAVLVFMAARFPGKRLLGFLAAFLSMFIAPVFLVIFGFLYITTDMHSRLMKGGTDAEKTE